MNGHNPTPVRVFTRPTRPDGAAARLTEYFGRNVFDINAMAKRMVPQDLETIRKVMLTGGRIDADLAERLATAVRDWATEKGATHFCHWFQPQTGDTAEKHEGFVSFDSNGRPVERFTGKELLQGEPDASSFPSGGLRSTFEARGYTGWDPSSPMFVMESENGMTLYIPSVFVSHNGEALDFKMPLLRSIEAISTEATRTLKLLGENKVNQVSVNIGAEQEFFVVERALAAQRPDLVMSGRTVLGNRPAKGQELEDHYFGNIPPRVHAFMEEVEVEAYKVGVPLKTRHNEVAPRQFEFAPIFGTANIASDHNHLLMKILRSVAARHGFMVLLHEKPFAGVNGSGKHVNWSLQDSTGRNVMDPGTTPHENIVFLTFLSAVLLGIQEHGEVIRASVASAGNDHRLGANEAPPAIMSAFLGQALDTVLNELEAGASVKSSAEKTLMNLGLRQLQELHRDCTDRNRTSPFAFTGNKFEFRAVGSSAPIAFPIAIVNAAFTSGLRKMNKLLEARANNGTVLADAALAVITDVIKKTKVVRYEGNGYSQEWKDEAARRGLANHPTTPAALSAIRNPEKTQFLVDTGVFSAADVESRLMVQVERYIKQRMIEVNVAIEMAQSGVLPAGMRNLAQMVSLARDSTASSIPSPALRMANDMGNACNRLEAALSNLKLATDKVNAMGHDNGELWRAAETISDVLMPKLEELRTAADAVESTLPSCERPFPSYSELLFTMEG